MTMTNPLSSPILDRLPASGATITRFALLDFENRVHDQDPDHPNQHGDLIGTYQITQTTSDSHFINATIASVVWTGRVSAAHFAKARDSERPVVIILKPAHSA